jgi:hypothetical protein
MPIAPTREQMWADYQLHRLKNFGVSAGVEPFFLPEYGSTDYYLRKTNAEANFKPAKLPDDLRERLEEFCEALRQSDAKYITVWDSLGTLGEDAQDLPGDAHV